MAVYKIFQTKDATLYSQYNEMNTGLDEIIEASTFTIGTDAAAQTSRMLIQFASSEITDLIDNCLDLEHIFSQGNPMCITNKNNILLNKKKIRYLIFNIEF